VGIFSLKIQFSTHFYKKKKEEEEKLINIIKTFLKHCLLTPKSSKE
jgi:hypothetical protein